MATRSKTMETEVPDTENPEVIDPETPNPEDVEPETETPDVPENKYMGTFSTRYGHEE